MKKEKFEAVVLMLVGILCFGVIFFVLMKHIFPVILPFLLAWLVSCGVIGPASHLEAKTRVSAKFWRPCLAVGSVVIIFAAISLLVWRLADFLRGLLTDILSGGELYTVLMHFSEPRLPFVDLGIPDELALKLSEGIRELLGVLLSRLADIVGNTVTLLPKALVFLLVTLTALVYFAIDIDRINGGIFSLFPEKTSKRISSLIHRFFEIIGKYVKSYLQIMLITFIIMLVGFMILGVEHAPLIAIIVAILDLLPILGVGIVLVPWSIFSFALGNNAAGIGLIVIFLSYTLIREILEPKILGKSLDVHPALTLVSLYLGYSLFGALGLIVFPIIAVLVCGLFKKDKTAEIG